MCTSRTRSRRRRKKKNIKNENKSGGKRRQKKKKEKRKLEEEEEEMTMKKKDGPRRRGRRGRAKAQTKKFKKRTINSMGACLWLWHCNAHDVISVTCSLSYSVSKVNGQRVVVRWGKIIQTKSMYVFYTPRPVHICFLN